MQAELHSLQVGLVTIDTNFDSKLATDNIATMATNTYTNNLIPFSIMPYMDYGTVGFIIIKYPEL